jgi:hypothetical protein
MRWVVNKRNLPLLGFFFFFNFSISTASPYFSPFMLKQLHFNGFQYTVLIAIPLITRIVFYRFFQKVTSIDTIKKIMTLSAVSISMLPIWWTVSQNFYYLSFFQAVSGLSWGGFELSLFLYFLDTKSDVERPRILVWINVIESCANLLGQSVGAMFLKYFEINRNTYLDLFLLSTGARLCSLFLLPYLIAQPLKFHRVFLRALSIRPNMGAVVRPVITDDEPIGK